MRKLSDLLIVALNYVNAKGEANPHHSGMCHYAYELKWQKLITEEEMAYLRWYIRRVLQRKSPDSNTASYVDLLLEEVLYEKHPMNPIIGWYNWYIWMCFDLRRKGL